MAVSLNPHQGPVFASCNGGREASSDERYSQDLEGGFSYFCDLNDKEFKELEAPSFEEASLQREWKIAWSFASVWREDGRPIVRFRDIKWTAEQCGRVARRLVARDGLFEDAIAIVLTHHHFRSMPMPMIVLDLLKIYLGSTHFRLENAFQGTLEIDNQLFQDLAFRMIFQEFIDGGHPEYRLANMLEVVKTQTSRSFLEAVKLTATRKEFCLENLNFIGRHMPSANYVYSTIKAAALGYAMNPNFVLTTFQRIVGKILSSQVRDKIVYEVVNEYYHMRREAFQELEDLKGWRSMVEQIADPEKKAMALSIV